MSKFLFLSINLIIVHVMAPDNKKNRKINAQLLEHEIFLMTTGNSYQKVQKNWGVTMLGYQIKHIDDNNVSTSFISAISASLLTVIFCS